MNKAGQSRNTVISAAICAAIVIAVLLMVSGCGFMFGEPREAARKASCQNNMKELGTAIIMYMGDYDSVLPSSYQYGRTKSWNKDAFNHFGGDKGTLPPNDYGSATHNTWPMLLYPYMRNKDNIWCPSDPADRDRASGRVSYYYKAAVDRAWYGADGVRCNKEGDFDFPADQVIFYEHNGWHWDQTDQGLTDGVTLNMTFMDGHVQAKRVRDSGYTQAENPPSPLPKSNAGEPAWYNYSGGNANPRYSTGPNWNPHVWYDNLP